MIRHDLRLSYGQIGLILAVPVLVSTLVEPVLGILGDTGMRSRLMVGGGAVFTASLVGFAISPGFVPLLAAASVMSPASGAFVGLAQATLMDARRSGRERAMTLWTAAGAFGAVVGPLVLAGLAVLHRGWRPLMAFAAILMLVASILSGIQLRGSRPQVDEEEGGLVAGMKSALHELRRPAVIRWLVLLECSDLLLDVLLGYLALYLVADAGVTTSQAAIAVTAWTGCDLAGTLFLLPLLSRFDGLRYLRWSAVAALIMYPLLLIVPGFGPKLVLIGALSLSNAGWYPVLSARLYGAIPERSGTVMALGTIAGAGAALIPLAVGLVAQRIGIQGALWILLAGPAALALAVPRRTEDGR